MNANETSSGKNKTLLEHRAETEAIFMSIGDGFIATDEFGKITRINPVALDLLGYKEKDLIGHWFPQKIVAVTADNKPIALIDRPMAKAYLTGKTISEKSWYRTAHGRLMPVHITVSPILLNNKPLGAIEIFRDITLDEEVDRMKSEFISLASHQLRTPLSSIKTYSHMLVDGFMGEITAPQKKSLKTIIAATNRMNELISTLLNITRIESGALDVSPKVIDCKRLTEEVMAELSLLASDKDINLSLRCIGKDSGRLKTDALILKEILTNLLSNAIKYTPAGGSVAAKIQARPKDILFTVSDTGWGIPKAAQEQIFSKFFRAHNISRRETTGTGLGLYLVKGLLEQLGGKIWFTSNEGEGSNFHFTLPRQQATAKKLKDQ